MDALGIMLANGDGGNIMTVGAGVIAAAGVAAAGVIAAYKKGRGDGVQLQEPVPDIPVTRKYTPPTFFQHRELEKRVDKIEIGMETLRRDQADQYRRILSAGEARTDRLADKLDGMARSIHARIDNMIVKKDPPSE